MSKDEITLYEIFSMSLIESFWARLFPKYLPRKINRKIKRYNEHIELYNKIKTNE